MNEASIFSFLSLTAVVASAFLSGCTSMGEPAFNGIERWRCGDYPDDCGGFFGSGCLVTVVADIHSGTGSVTFGEFVELTNFQIQGIERRWDWCLNADGSFECSFVVSVDGNGRYYNFYGSDDGTARPADIFLCTQY